MPFEVTLLLSSGFYVCFGCGVACWLFLALLSWQNINYWGCFLSVVHLCVGVLAAVAVLWFGSCDGAVAGWFRHS